MYISVLYILYVILYLYIVARRDFIYYIGRLYTNSIRKIYTKGRLYKSNTEKLYTKGRLYESNTGKLYIGACL